ncbi:MAG: IgGFc-binding protein [Deltaproteobacteria bacterium]|nr:IgGFc-binding protein [Deltaproteobacteria bacterium]
MRSATLWFASLSIATLVAACSCGGSDNSLFANNGQGGSPDGGAGSGGTAGNPSTGGTAGSGGTAGQGGTAGEGGTAGLGGTAGTGGTAGAGGSAAGGTAGTSGTGGTGGAPPDPEDCATAASLRSNIGCEFWPTVTANLVWSIFDFAVLAVNPGSLPAVVQVNGPSGFNLQINVAPGASEPIYLPWVASLKGADTDTCGTATAPTSSVRENKGAYHLSSTRAIAVFQFNPIEYKGVNGPPGKSWTACPGLQNCSSSLTSIGCFSFSSDASMLLPTASLTGTYRVAGPPGWASNGQGVMPSYIVITATQDNTNVGLTLKGSTLAGGGLGAMNAGMSTSVTMQAGDVLELVGGSLETDDLSGTLISASAPVQVISGMPCRDFPSDTAACDHLEETVPPAETLGKQYVVSLPAAPNGIKAPSQRVRVIGNVNNTKVTFDPPITAPGVTGGQAMLDAGMVLDLGMQPVDFKVSGDKEILVVAFMAGAGIVDPSTQPPDQKGDPSQSYVVAVEQFRDAYTFAVPVDYETNYVNVVAPSSATVMLDGVAVQGSSWTAIGSSGMSVARLALPTGGLHRVSSTAPIGVQAYGYGNYTSYQMPGGANAHMIAPVPQP